MNCRAYPDEKGIETCHTCFATANRNPANCRAYPDEKGIETHPGSLARFRKSLTLQSLSR